MRAASRDDSPVVSAPRAVAHQPIALVDLLDRLLAGGVVVSGEIRLSIADVDMVTVSLQALISSVSTVLGSSPGASGNGGARDDSARDDEDWEAHG